MTALWNRFRSIWDEFRSIFAYMSAYNKIIVFASVLTAIATAVTAYAAFRIPNAINKETTLEQVNDASRRIDAAIAEKIKFEMQACRDIYGECSYAKEENCKKKRSELEKNEFFEGTRICVLDENDDPCGDMAFDYRYISKNKEIEGFVFSILNEYETLCLGGNEGILDNKIINLLRGYALEETRKQYGDYIEKFRDDQKSKKENQDDKAWQPCDDWLDEYR